MLRLRRILSTVFGDVENPSLKKDTRLDNKTIPEGVFLRLNGKHTCETPNPREKRNGICISHVLHIRSLKRRWKPEGDTSDQEETVLKRNRFDESLEQRTSTSSEHDVQPAIFVSAVAPNYFSIDSNDYIVEKEKIKLGEVIGEGQFGVVHQSLFRANDSDVPVAVKTCKFKADSNSLDRFLGEALLMQRFDHAHIVKLVCICSDTPLWIVTELAEHGDLRSYLQCHKHMLGLITLLIFDYQLSAALVYLESIGIVHRDIAARNVFVFSYDCVKLGDFGMSRWIPDGQSYYKATPKDKLSPWPIKWLSPENLSYGHFSSKSDVWMFGICTWEIFMFGEKPYAKVHSNEVVENIKTGSRLSLPQNCPPKLCALLSQCWDYEPINRPSFHHLKESLYDLIVEEKQLNTEACTVAVSELNISTG